MDDSRRAEYEAATNTKPAAGTLTPHDVGRRDEDERTNFWALHPLEPTLGPLLGPDLEADFNSLLDADHGSPRFQPESPPCSPLGSPISPEGSSTTHVQATAPPTFVHVPAHNRTHLTTLSHLPHLKSHLSKSEKTLYFYIGS